MTIADSYFLVCRQIHMDYWECTTLLLLFKKQKNSDCRAAPKVAGLPSMLLNKNVDLPLFPTWCFLPTTNFVIPFELNWHLLDNEIPSSYYSLSPPSPQHGSYVIELNLLKRIHRFGGRSHNYVMRCPTVLSPPNREHIQCDPDFIQVCLFTKCRCFSILLLVYYYSVLFFSS